MSSSGRARETVDIEATYRVVTPLFCAGADPDRPEIRLPSFKGVLRYWWRALAWARCGGDLAAVRKEEDALFGSTDGGRSRVSMRLKQGTAAKSIAKGTVIQTPGTGRAVGEGARYLGYGVMEAFASRKKRTSAGELTRACLAAPFDFTVRMRGRSLTERQLTSLMDALVALGTLGGMGAKSRKGYGSLALRSLRVDGVAKWKQPQDASELRRTVVGLRDEESEAGLTKFPPFTAFGKGTRHILLSGDVKEPLALLNLVGREMMRYRSWGHRGKVLGSNSEKKFTYDHDLMKQDVCRCKRHPRRIAFGLPHNYGQRQDQQVSPCHKDLDRRASPLFIHIHPCGDTPVAVLSFFPSSFLPKDNSGKSFICVGGKKVPQTPESELYQPICAFLDRLLDPRERKEPFTHAEEVSP